MEANLFVEIEENNCISIYKLGSNTTHSRKVSKNFQIATRKLTTATVSFRKLTRLSGGGH